MIIQIIIIKVTMFLCAHFKSVWAFMSSIKSIVNTKYLKHEISKNISNNSLSLKKKLPN